MVDTPLTIMVKTQEKVLAAGLMKVILLVGCHLFDFSAASFYDAVIAGGKERHGHTDLPVAKFLRRWFPIKIYASCQQHTARVSRGFRASSVVAVVYCLELILAK
jgi:hypothetical protein